MSAWSEAVWIVEQLESSLSIDGLIKEYKEKIQALKDTLNDLQDEIDAASKVSTPYVQTGEPTNMEDGSVWFIVQEE